MTQRLERFFDPCLQVRLLCGRIVPEFVRDYALFKQFANHAKLINGVRESDYDRFLAAAGEFGYSVELVAC